MSAKTSNNRRSSLIIALSLVLPLGTSTVCAGPLKVSPPRDELAMIIAASTGNLAAVKRLVSKGMDLDHSDFTGNTPLIYAARYARVTLVEYLLRHGADVNAYTHWGTTALIEAVRKGSFPVVQDLLDAGADVDQLNNKHESALFDAVKYRRLWAVNMLLYRNAQTDIKNTLGYTPLAYALEEHQTQIVTALQQHGVADRLAVRDDMPALTGTAVDASAGHPMSRRISSVSLLR
jgi:ankyrin repeat protein